MSRSNLHSINGNGRSDMNSNQTISSGKSENSALKKKSSLISRIASSRKKEFNDSSTRWNSRDLPTASNHSLLSSNKPRYLNLTLAVNGYERYSHLVNSRSSSVPPTLNPASGDSNSILDPALLKPLPWRRSFQNRTTEQLCPEMQTNLASAGAVHQVRSSLSLITLQIDPAPVPMPTSVELRSRDRVSQF
ncbi:hypothetical protein Ciccas_013034 [Cichlidogyrus casuarinus]|uniref:Uncharacterized protein n=1 Tax=Cichlidogyrus casuarinus TaxID=1844966 RepID=A0ABD2PM79_9PLAT